MIQEYKHTPLDTETYKNGEQKMKKLIYKIKEWFVWLMSRKVMDAINNGATYEEVEEIVKQEVHR